MSPKSERPSAVTPSLSYPKPRNGLDCTMNTTGSVTEQLTPQDADARLEPWTREGMERLRKQASAMEDALRHTQAALQTIFAAGCFDFLPPNKSDHDGHEAGVALLEMIVISVRSAAEPGGEDLSFELSRVADKLDAMEARHG